MRHHEDEIMYDEEWDEEWPEEHYVEPFPPPSLALRVVHRVYWPAALVFMIWLLHECAVHPWLHHILFAGL
jgi:hypothetical protein